MDTVHGKITGVAASWGSGLATLYVDGVAYHADNAPLFRGLDAAFGCIAPGHRIDSEKLVGQDIILHVDDLGIIAGFDIPVYL